MTWTDTEHDNTKLYCGCLLKKWGCSDYVTEINYQAGLGTELGDRAAMMLLKQAIILGFMSNNLLTSLKTTLNGATMLGSTHCPHTATKSAHDYITVYRFAAPFMYSFAEEVGYLTGKWHGRLAWEEIKDVLVAGGNKGLYLLDPRDNSYDVGVNRFYDENAESLDLLLSFYEMDRINNLGALTYAKDTLWAYINANHWNTDHYDYRPDWSGYECGGGAFALIIAKLRALCDYDLDDWDNLITDVKARFLNDDWDSPQWTYGSTKYYSIVHHHDANEQRRLGETLTSWIMLHAFYQILDATSQAHMTTLLDGATKAWEHLLASSGLYVAGDKMFKSFSDDGASSEIATSMGIVLLYLMGIVPDTGSLYAPIFEYAYLCRSCLNKYFSFDYTNRVIRLPIKAGTLKFIYGSTATQHNFKTDGVYDISFTSDWNNISDVVKVTDLHSGLKYVTPIARIEESLPTTKAMYDKFRTIPTQFGRTVVRRELKLSPFRDSTTGWNYHTYWDREIVMVVVPQGATQLQTETGLYPKLDAIGVTQSPIRMGDQIKTSDGGYYKVETVTDHYDKDEYVISKCDLVALTVYEEA